MNDVVHIEGLELGFSRKQRVLSEFDLTLEPGAVTVLLGTNGAGKSCLLRALIGVLRPRRGTVRVFGLDPVREQRAVLTRTGYVPDTPDVYPWMKVRELFRFLEPQYPTWNAQLAHELCDRLAVPPRTKFKHMSRGQGMKAMLVAALAYEPELLLLDEPFAGLDPVVREDVLSGVIDSLRAGRRTVLCATHELDIAARIADRVAVLHDGRIVAHDTLDAVTERLEGPAAATPTCLKNLLVEASA
ncbi:MAG: ABC transporter ATP-binding protein [Planctomycetes bacterium]|nr:ABC transporter ATP-binding protein [Planctomycetota bacterium]